MKRKWFNIIFSIVLFTFLLGGACKKKDSPTEPEEQNQSTSDYIKTGETVPVKSEPIGSGGGTIIISAKDNPLNGLQLIIPPNSYGTSKTFDISYAKVESHKLGDNYKIVAPMVKIKNGGGYADDYMSLKIPIKKEKDEFAMGFFYNEQTGKLEGLPLIAADDSSVTIATRHFSSSSLAAGKKLGKANDANSVSNVIITSLKESFLNNQSIISTGFTPGVDDWEFTNFGSYISPGGHCAGQSISAMWYYFEKKLKGAGKLYHSYDKLYTHNGQRDTTWFDNKYGFRFASVIQEELQWNGKLFKLFEKIETTPHFHFLSWKAFAFSMLVTGEPQFVGLTSNSGGHAIIAHKISLTEKKLYVCDPNYPGQEKIITFNGNKFDNYKTRQNADAPESDYFGIGYYSKTSMIDWDKIGTYWTQFENKTIGSNKFPVIKIKYKLDKDWVELMDTLTTSLDSLQITTEPSAGLIGIDEKGKQFKSAFKFPLELGKHQYGFALFLKPAGNNNYKWVDFRWVTIERKAPPYPRATIVLNAIDVNKNFIMLNTGANVTTAGWTNKPPSEPVKQALNWTGNKFFVEYNYIYTVSSYLTVEYSGRISGELDPVAKKIKQLSAIVVANTDNGTSITTQSVVLEDVPVSISEKEISAQTAEGDIKKYVKDFQLTITGVSYTGNYVWTVSSIDWSNSRLSLYLMQ
jgi:hypothetical protein